jgi:hypothetical protein
LHQEEALLVADHKAVGLAAAAAAAAGSSVGRSDIDLRRAAVQKKVLCSLQWEVGSSQGLISSYDPLIP